MYYVCLKHKTGMGVPKAARNEEINCTKAFLLLNVFTCGISKQHTVISCIYYVTVLKCYGRI